MSRAFWRRWRAIDEDRERLGVSFAWPDNGTDLTREQIEIAMRESAASPSQPEAGRPVATTAHDAPPPQQWQPGPTPVLGYGDALDDKPAIRRQLAACRGECGDGPPDYSEWSR